MAQIVDTPRRRAFMAKLGEQGWLGMTWPKEYGGTEGEGIYEYLLNEQLAGRGGPQIGKGVGIIGKTLIRHGNERLKQEFLPKILRNEVEFAVGYCEPDAGSDAASMKLKAIKDGDGWMLNGQKVWTTSAHFAEWYWLGARTDPDDKHQGITLFLVPLDHPGITIKEIWTMGDERTNEVFLDDVWVHDDYVVGEVNKGFQYISEALDLERFTMFTFSPIKQRFDILVEYVRIASRGRRAAAGRPGHPPAHGPAGHRPGGRPGARPAGRARVDEGRRPADDPVLGVQALHHRAVQAAGRRLHGHLRARQPAAGAHRGGPAGGPVRVDLPLHGHRHHRRRHLRGAEEHHRPAQARPPQELLMAGGAVPPRRASRVLDFSTVGPAARCASRWLADYGADVVKIGAPAKAGAVQIEPPSTPTRPPGHARIRLDLKADAGRAAFLRLAADGRRRHRELPARRRRPAGHRLRRP